MCQGQALLLNVLSTSFNNNNINNSNNNNNNNNNNIMGTIRSRTDISSGCLKLYQMELKRRIFSKMRVRFQTFGTF